MTLPTEPILLRSDSLVLRPFAESDLPAALVAFADEEMALWNPGPTDDSEAAAWLRKRNDWSTGDHASWAVSDPDGGLVGGISMHHIDFKNRDAEVGYWVAPWARRRGVGRGALSMLVEFGFSQLTLHRIYLYHAVENLASCRLAVSVGFRHEGDLRSSYECGDGRYHDEHLHGLLEDERRPQVSLAVGG